jgi:hypothetical protein
VLCTILGGVLPGSNYINMLKVFCFVILTVICFWLLASIVGCEVLKGKREVRTDSTSVVKKDSGSLFVNSSNRSDSSAYWREIWTLARDTNVTVNNIYPTSYTKEYGVREIKETELVYDSSWKQAYDSLNKKVDSFEKTKETKVLTQWWIWVIGGIVVLASIKSLIGSLPFTITRK